MKKRHRRHVVDGIEKFRTGNVCDLNQSRLSWQPPKIHRDFARDYHPDSNKQNTTVQNCWDIRTKDGGNNRNKSECPTEVANFMMVRSTPDPIRTSSE